MAHIYEKLFNLTIGLLATANMEGYFERLNPSWSATLGWSLDELRAKPYLDFVHPDDREATIVEATRLSEEKPTIQFENRYRCKDGSYRWISWNCQTGSGETPEARLIYASATDVTPHRELRAQLEEALAQAQALEEQLRAQHAQLRVALQAMSTPLIPITDRIMVMPLIGQMDAARASQVMSAALDGVQRAGAQVVILDVTGLQHMDPQVASALVGTGRALRLLGAQTILTGIRPALAQTLVDLGLELSEVETQGTLQSAVAYALRRGRA